MTTLAMRGTSWKGVSVCPSDKSPLNHSLTKHCTLIQKDFEERFEICPGPIFCKLLTRNYSKTCNCRSTARIISSRECYVVYFKIFWELWKFEAQFTRGERKMKQCGLTKAVCGCRNIISWEQLQTDFKNFTVLSILY